MNQSNSNSRTLGKKDMVLFTVSAILLLDTLAATASIGASSVFWWIFLGVIFYIPFALICAELGCSYPERGGIYAWVRDAYGRNWGSRITWSYWVNVAIWMPAIFILFAGVFKQLFFPELSAGAQIVLGLVLTWIAVGANIVTLEMGKWVPNVGAVFKVVIFLAIIIGAVFYVKDHGIANAMTLQTMKPDWGASLQYIPAIIYGMLGFELVSASSDDMKNPASDLPRSIFISGVIIIALYLFGTVAILAAIPAENINLLEGLVDTLRLFFADVPYGETIVLILGVATLFTFFSNGVTWAMGCNRAAAEAAAEGELPAVFAVQSKKRQTPLGAAILMGIVSSIILVLYGLLVDSNEDLFWSLFAFSGVIFLLPYIGMLLAFVKLRATDPDRPRPFKIVGGLLVAKIMAYVCVAILILSIVLFIYTPGEGVQWAVLIGALTILLLGEAAIYFAEREKRNQLSFS